MNPTTLSQIESSVSNGASLSELRYTGAGVPLLHGRPVIESEYAPAFTGTTASTAQLLVLVDLSDGFLVANRVPTVVELTQTAQLPGSTPTMQKFLISSPRVAFGCWIPTSPGSWPTHEQATAPPSDRAIPTQARDSQTGEQSEGSEVEPGGGPGLPDRRGRGDLGPRPARDADRSLSSVCTPHIRQLRRAAAGFGESPTASLARPSPPSRPSSTSRGRSGPWRPTLSASQERAGRRHSKPG